MTMSELDFGFRKKVPVLLQAEMAECGIACIAMVASYFGHKLDLNAMRTRFPTSLKGLNLKSVIGIAEHCDLLSRAIRCEPEELGELSLPAILHWDLNHFVVLVSVKQNCLWVHDPAVGKRKIDRKECSRRFTGVALELRAANHFVKKDDTQPMPMRQLWSKLTHLYQALAGLFALSMLIQLAGIASPYYMQWVVDHVLITGDRDLLLVLAMGFTLLMITSTFVSSLRSWLVLRLSSSLSLQMGGNLLAHLMSLPLSYFEQRHIGDVSSRFASLASVRERMTTGVVETIVDGVMSIMVLVVMLFYSVPLTLLVLAAVSLYSLVRFISYGPLYRASESAIQAGALEQSNFLENLRGMQTIKMFSAENFRLGLWQNLYTDLINSEVRVGKLNIAFSVFNGVIFGLENILIIYFAALAVLDTSMSIGMVLAFLAYKSQLSGRLSNLVEQWISFRMLRLHLDRLADIAMSNPEQGFRIEAPIQWSSAKGCIDVEDLSFRYSDQEPFVLKDVSFSVQPGESVAIVGPSGEGKTTLIKLLSGLMLPTSGKILFDGLDIRQIGPRNARQHIGSVMQSDTLLSGSVLENISFFDLNPNLLKVQQCATLAGIDQEISALPMGYHSRVGDMGNQFSGGQVQRILLARAIYRQPRILILDEATSHLDLAREQRIAEQIRGLSMTRIIVAHRPETIREADKVFVLQQGELRSQALYQLDA